VPATNHIKLAQVEGENEQSKVRVKVLSRWIIIIIIIIIIVREQPLSTCNTISSAEN